LKKIISLLLVLVMLFTSSALLFSCSEPELPDTPDSENKEPENNDPTDSEKPDTDYENKPLITVPPYKDYGRGTVNFTEIAYTRPSVAEIVESFEGVTEAIKLGEGSFEEQLASIKALEDSYTLLKTMYTMAEVLCHKDSSNSFFSEEYAYLSSSYPDFSRAVEDLYVAAAQSENAKKFEDEYFGEGLIEEYADGGIYTEELVELFKKEAELEAEYTSLSTATVEITVSGKTGTVDSFLEEAKAKYSSTSNYYTQLCNTYLSMYRMRCKEISKSIFVELVKIRRQIADELGYESYTEYAYEAMEHGYSEKELLTLLGTVKTDVLPVYNAIYNVVYDVNFKPSNTGTTTRENTINNLYEIYKTVDADIADIYAYMLQHGLYDVDNASPNRFSGAFTAYLEGNESPFLFATVSNYALDYLTLAHEFGHFVDGYVNYGESASLDIAEISSQGLELLTLLELDKTLQEGHFNTLKNYKLISLLDSLMSQAVYAMYEHMVYELPLEEITEAKLDALAAEASEEVLGAVYGNVDSLEDMIITHTVLYPMYVQSYTVSLISAFEIFFIEIENDGKGYEAYKTLINREDNAGLSDIELLTTAGLSSPFKPGLMKELVEKLYEYMTGGKYGIQSGGSLDAA